MKAKNFHPWAFFAPAVRRVWVWAISLSILIVLTTIIYAVLREPLDLPRHGWARWLPLALGLLPLCIILPTSHWILRNIRKDWATSGGRLCTHCAYDVSKLPPAGKCPECGKNYDILADAQVWKLSGLKTPDAEPPVSSN